MAADSFPDEVATHLGWYVYRLIDPRNGQTFYVGKGKGDRLFAHVKETIQLVADAGDVEDAQDLKMQQIRAIKAAGLDVGHVIHRFGLPSPEVAYEVEAAVIDCYQGLVNQVTGHGSNEFGCRHAEQIIQEFKAETFDAKEPLLLISVGVTYDEGSRSIYDAVRGVWRINRKNVAPGLLVLAHRRGIVVGAFRAEQWVDATVENFHWLDADIPGRIGFVGREAETEALNYYVKKRVPERYRPRGAANPVRYLEPNSEVVSAAI